MSGTFRVLFVGMKPRQDVELCEGASRLATCLNWSLHGNDGSDWIEFLFFTLYETDRARVFDSLINLSVL